MRTRTTVLLLVLAAIVAALAGYWTGLSRLGPHAEEALFNARFVDVDDQPQTFEQWRGKIMVVNFWATWCPPCRVEIPGFIRLQNKYKDRGLVFVGIALDQRDKVQAFMKEVGINYPILLAGPEAMDLARALGNQSGGLPYTLIVNAQGNISFKKVGGVNELQLERALEDLF